jgi:hypothetical protein
VPAEHTEVRSFVRGVQVGNRSRWRLPARASLSATFIVSLPTCGLQPSALPLRVEPTVEVSGQSGPRQRRCRRARAQCLLLGTCWYLETLPVRRFDPKLGASAPSTHARRDASLRELG